MNVDAIKIAPGIELARGAGMTGAADSKRLTLAVSLLVDGSDTADLLFLSGQQGLSARFNVRRGLAGDGKLMFEFDNTTGGLALDMRTQDTFLVGSGWLRCLLSVDLAVPNSQRLYINDVRVPLSTDNDANALMDFVVTNWRIRGNGAIAEYYVNIVDYVDLDVESERRKFYAANGEPADLGDDGSLPTGTAPIMYLHLDAGEDPTHFATNRGTGGNLTITGTLETHASSPSDIVQGTVAATDTRDTASASGTVIAPAPAVVQPVESHGRGPRHSRIVQPGRPIDELLREWEREVEREREERERAARARVSAVDTAALEAAQARADDELLLLLAA